MLLWRPVDSIGEAAASIASRGEQRLGAGNVSARVSRSRHSSQHAGAGAGRLSCQHLYT